MDARGNGRVVEATAPARIDLAGATLDIWPLFLFHRGAVTVNVAIDRRAWCRVETGVVGVHIESKDTLTRTEGRDVEEVLAGGTLSLVGFILRALGIESGLKVTTQLRVPADSGLGGFSALAVAIAAAASQAIGRELGPDELCPIVRDAEAQCIGVPTGVQDYHSAIHGGVLGVHLDAGTVRVERLATDPGRVEESVLLVDGRATRPSGGGKNPGAERAAGPAEPGSPRSVGATHNWDAFKGQIDGDPAVRKSLGEIAEVARRVRRALLEHRYGEVAALVAEEWEARKRLAPALTTPEIDRITEVARSVGGAAKACGAEGGGMVVVWAPPGERGPGTRERVEAALREAGFPPIPFRVDLRGLEVE